MPKTYQRRANTSTPARIRENVWCTLVFLSHEEVVHFNARTEESLHGVVGTSADPSICQVGIGKQER